MKLNTKIDIRDIIQNSLIGSALLYGSQPCGHLLVILYCLGVRYAAKGNKVLSMILRPFYLATAAMLCPIPDCAPAYGLMLSLLFGQNFLIELDTNYLLPEIQKMIPMQDLE